MSAEAPNGTPNPYIITAYRELCRSYQGLHDFRMKLLGLLPIASIAALLALLGKTTTQFPPPMSLEAKLSATSACFPLFSPWRCSSTRHAGS